MVGFLFLCPRKEQNFFIQYLLVRGFGVFSYVTCNNSVTRVVVCYIRVTKIGCFVQFVQIFVRFGM